MSMIGTFPRLKNVIPNQKAADLGYEYLGPPTSVSPTTVTRVSGKLEHGVGGNK